MSEKMTAIVLFALCTSQLVVVYLDLRTADALLQCSVIRKTQPNDAVQAILCNLFQQIID